MKSQKKTVSQIKKQRVRYSIYEEQKKKLRVRYRLKTESQIYPSDTCMSGGVSSTISKMTDYFVFTDMSERAVRRCDVTILLVTMLL